jgi:hypothetical protein
LSTSENAQQRAAFILLLQRDPEMFDDATDRSRKPAHLAERRLPAD